MPTRTNRDGETIDYAGEWVAIDTYVSLGAGGTTASYDVLLNRGLYSLSPELGLQAKRRNVHLYSALKAIRSYCFGCGRSWPVAETEIAAAMKLAAAFGAVGGQAMVGVGEVVQKHLLAWFLSMRKRDTCNITALTSRLVSVNARPPRSGGGCGTSTATRIPAGAVAHRGLKRKMSQAIDLRGDDDGILIPASKRPALRNSTAPLSHSGPSSSYSSMSSTARTLAKSPEIKQYEVLLTILEYGQLRLRAADLTTIISPSTLANDRASWQTWFRENRERDKGARGEPSGVGGVRSGRVEKKRRYGPRKPHSERGGRR